MTTDLVYKKSFVLLICCVGRRFLVPGMRYALSRICTNDLCKRYTSVGVENFDNDHLGKIVNKCVLQYSEITCVAGI